MKILFFCSGNNGISPIIQAQALSLGQNGADVDIVPLIGKGFWGYLKFIGELKRQIIFLKPDIIHAHYSFCGIIASLSTRKPVICSLMGSDIIAAGYFQIIIKLFSLFFWQSTIVKSEEMRSRIGIKQCKVIPNGVDISIFQSLSKEKCRLELGWNQDSKIALFVGNPDRKEKNHALAKRAVELLGSEKYELKIANNISHDYINAFINAADVLVLPSLWEGSPNIVKEAMACNIPVVSTDVGDVKWLFGDFKGYYISAFNPLEFSEMVKQAADFGITKGRDRIIELGLDSNAVAQKLISIYTKYLPKSVCIANMNLALFDHKSINRKQWDEYINHHEFGTIFLSSAFFDIYQNTPDYKPFALFALGTDNKIQALLVGYIQTVSSGVLSAFSKRAVLFNAPIADNSDSMEFLVKSLIKYLYHKCIYMEIRNHYDLSEFSPVFEKCCFEYRKHVNILVDLSKSEDILYKELAPNRRKEINKAIKEGLSFDVDNTEINKTLYPILKQIYTRAKLPLVSEEYINQIYNLPKEYYQVCGVLIDNIVVGAVLLICYKNVVYSIYGGCKEEYFKKRPNDFLFWQVILWAKSQGYKTYDWMGAGNPDIPYGVRDWKKQFGGEFVSYGRYHYNQYKFLFKIAEFIFSQYRRFRKKK